MTDSMAINLIVYILAVIPTYVAIMVIYHLCSRLMGTIDTLQRDQSRIITEMLASKTRLETGDSFTAGQILQHSENHDRRSSAPEIPQSFKAGIPAEEDNVAAMGLHESPEVVFGEDIGDVPRPGVET